MLAANKNKQIIIERWNIRHKQGILFLFFYPILSDHNNHRNRTHVLLVCSSSSPTLSRTWCGDCEGRACEDPGTCANKNKKKQDKTRQNKTKQKNTNNTLEALTTQTKQTISVHNNIFVILLIQIISSVSQSSQRQTSSSKMIQTSYQKHYTKLNSTYTNK